MADSQFIGLIYDRGQEISNGFSLVGSLLCYRHIILVQIYVFSSSLEVLQLPTHLLQLISMISYFLLFRNHILILFVCIDELPALLGEGENLELDIFDFELLSHLDAFAEYCDIVVLIIELLNYVRLIHSVCPSQIAEVLLPGLEGKHMVKLILCWSPERTIKWELEVFSTASPVVVYVGGKCFENRLRNQLPLILPLNEAYNPALVSRQYVVPPSLSLQFHNDSPQEYFIYSCVFKAIFFAQSLQKQAIHFRQLIRIYPGEVKKGRKPYIVQRYSGKGFALGYSRHCLYLRDNDLLFALLLVLLAVCLRLRKQFVSCLQSFKLLSTGHNLKRLRCIKFALVSSHNIVQNIIISRSHYFNRTSLIQIRTIKNHAYFAINSKRGLGKMIILSVAQ